VGVMGRDGEGLESHETDFDAGDLRLEQWRYFHLA